jgi:hypothetical protein
LKGTKAGRLNKLYTAPDLDYNQCPKWEFIKNRVNFYFPPFLKYVNPPFCKFIFPSFFQVPKKEPALVDPATPTKMYSPLFGMSNAYFLTQPPPLKTILENSSKCEETKSSFSSNPSLPAVPEQLIKDLPTLLSQVSQVRP